jgi:hypothetical protein
MPESPDFNQIARDLAEGMQAPADSIDPLVEVLRQVWNAGRAADVATIEALNARVAQLEAQLEAQLDDVPPGT